MLKSIQTEIVGTGSPDKPIEVFKPGNWELGIGIYANVGAKQKHLRRLGIGFAPKIFYAQKFLGAIWNWDRSESFC
jgi:hypothetical protein